MAQPRLSLLMVENHQSLSQLWGTQLQELADWVIARSPAEGQASFHSRAFDVVVIALESTEGTPAALFRTIAAARDDVPVILLTNNPRLEAALHDVQLTDYDSVVFPAQARLLRHRLSRIARLRQLANEAATLQQQLATWLPRQRDFVGSSTPLVHLRQQLSHLAQSLVPAFIVGEIGTGRTLAATMIHNQSTRAAGPFIPVRCDRLDAETAAYALFGYPAGLGAPAAHRGGLIRLAAGGTLLLQELGQLDLDLQARLLEVIETGQTRRAGDTEPYRTDVRWLATTRQDPGEELREGRLHKGLFEHMVQVHLPPLRQIPHDIAAIAQALLAQAAVTTGRSLHLANETLQDLSNYFWPGNVSELRAIVERAALLAGGTELLPEHINQPILPSAISLLDPWSYVDGPPRQQTLAEMESRMIQAAMRAHGGNKTVAAKALGISLRTLYNKLEGRGSHLPKGMA